MKKKILIIGAILLVISIGAVLILTNMFTIGKITGKLYRIDNVYEEIWNMVISEKHGEPTVLTTTIKGSEVDYDFGVFERVNIPVHDKYTVVLSFYQNELCIWLFEKNSNNSALYVYNWQNNILYGEQEESLLMDTFLSLYFSWVEGDGRFTSDNKGDYTYVYAEFPLSHE